MITLLLAGLALLPPALGSDFDLYSRLYPTHAEFCAGTKFQFIGGVSGGAGGHGLVYLNGLCKDYSKPYPQVKVCDGTEGHSGVGISLNSDFQNVKWTAIPTHALLLDGNLRDGESITPATLDRVADDANRLRVFEGIVIKPELARDSSGRQLIPGTPDYLRAVAKNSQGTDYAFRFARNLECVRVPFPHERLARIVAHLNQINDSYYKTGKTFVWSGPLDNCVHLVSEILEKAGIRKAIPKGSYLNLAIPRNGAYTLLQIGLWRSTDPSDVYDRDADRRSIRSKTPWMPTQVGVLAKKYSAFRDNTVFEISDEALWFIPRSEFAHFLDAQSAFSEPKASTSQILPNLQAWEKRYAADLKKASARPGFFEADDYVDFKDDYARYLRERLEWVRQSIARF